jgi:hypothetical protein
MATRYSPSIVTSGLVLCLDAANNKSYSGTGTSWADLSGNNYNGTLTNSPTFSGLNGGNIVLNGTNQYVNINYNVNLNPATNVSVSVWARLTVNDANIRNPIELSASADELYWIFLRADLSPKRWGWGVRQSNNTYAETTSNTTNPSIDTWYNLTLVANSSTLLVSLYINGILDGSVAYNGTIKQNAVATLSIGRDPGANRRYWQGNIANTQIYNRALTDVEILQNYNATKSRFGL